MRFFSLFLFLGMCFTVFTLSSENASAQQSLYRQNLKVVATTSQIADLVRQITGERVQVINLMSPGSDPHLFRPTRSDLYTLKQADIIFYNGLHLEAQMIDVFKRLAKDKPVVAVSDGLNIKDIIKDEGTPFDPHIWMNVNYWRQCLKPIISTLEHYVTDKQFRDIVDKARDYEEQMDTLDYRVQVAVASIPHHKRILISSHDAFGYFGQAYGMDVIGIQGLSTESEAGLMHIENIIDLIIEHEVPAIFAETSVDSRNVEAIVEGALARGYTLEIGGTLYSDSLGPVGSDASTYLGMMVHNVSAIANALGGDDSAILEYKLEMLRHK